MSVECSTSVFAAHWILHSRNLRENEKLYYIIELYYFVAFSFAYLHAYFVNVFLKIKNVDKIKKNVKNVKNVTKIKNVKTFLHLCFEVRVQYRRKQVHIRYLIPWWVLVVYRDYTERRQYNLEA